MNREPSQLCSKPEHYEIAFSFRDISAEVDVFEQCFRRFSVIPVRSVLELGGGNCPHMEELTGRGQKYTGLDVSRAMLEYSRKKALRVGAEIKLIHGDLNEFSLETTIDFVYVLLGSLSVKSTSELTRHFNSVANALNKGGLYLLDWCIQLDPPWAAEGGETWEIEREGVRVKTAVF